VHRDIGPFADGVYTFSGKFRKAPESGMAPAIEHLDVNISLVQNYTEYYAEIFWTLNKWDPKYGWIWTRNALCDVNDPACVASGGVVQITTVPEDTQWHTFSITVNYNGTDRNIKIIAIDGVDYDVNIAMGVNPVPKPWPYHFKVLCEMQNTNTNCDPTKVFVGKSEWDDLKVEHSCLLRTANVQELKKAKLTIFPNPAQDYVQVATAMSNAKYYIYGIEGELVSSGVLKETKQISMSNIKSGMYLLRVQQKLGKEETVFFIRESN